MSGGIASAFSSPHVFRNPHQSPAPFYPVSSHYTPVSTMSSRKRKASEDADLPDLMSSSPTPSPAISSRPLASQSTPLRTPKRLRTNNTGRPLPLPRLLETLSPEEMRTVLTTLCTRHPAIAAELTSTAPRPSVNSAISVLHSYQAALRESFPYGDRMTSEYSFNRVRHSLTALLDALRDYTPQYLPPNESQTATSLAFLDGATQIVQQLPEWETFQHNRYKHEAYEEISAAWALVIREAAKKGGGIQIQYGSWDQKLVKHNELSGGKLGEAVQALRECLGWIGNGNGNGNGGHAAGQQEMVDAERAAIRQQLFSGTYGSPVQVGPW